MKLILFVALALADDSKQEKVPKEESMVEQAVQMNEQLSEILARIEEIKTETESAQMIESTPAKRVEPKKTNP
tara:strand:- start:289 stop:507 length:219 start_codon:yes stop_codon:yes gene_type:complete